MYKIYVVEDEMDLAVLLCKYLKNEGYDVTHFRTGEQAISKVDEEVDLWILDIMLPGSISGYDLIKKIRETNCKKPVIFTSARDQDIDKIMGLELGGDDYVPKPYSLRELMLRVKSVLSRVYASRIENVMIHDGYHIDLDKRIVKIENELINLTSKEYDLLLFLVRNQAKAFSRDQILNHVWGEEYFGSDRVVDDLMRRLRSKMPNLRVETIYGYGYRLV